MVDVESKPGFIFTVEAEDGQRFIVQHFPATSPAPVNVTSIRDRHTQVIPGDRYETAAGDRVEPELIPHGNGHTSMAFWVHRVQFLDLAQRGKREAPQAPPPHVLCLRCRAWLAEVKWV